MKTKTLMCGLVLTALLTILGCSTTPLIHGEVNDIDTVVAQHKSGTDKETVELDKDKVIVTKMKEVDVKFKLGDQELAGSLILPEGKGPFPLIIFIHGDGPMDRKAFHFYQPIFQCFVNLGAACFSWDKPGVGESTNKFTGWRHQGCADRIDEVRAAIAAMQERENIDNTQIGLWGVSQAAWVAPKIAIEYDLSFVIEVSCPARTPAEQTAYLVRLTLENKNYAGKEIDTALTTLNVILSLWGKGLPHKDFKKKYEEIVAPYKSTSWFKEQGVYSMPLDLQKYETLSDSLFINPFPWLEKVQCPLLAIFGDKDENIDPKVNYQLFEQIITDNQKGSWEIVMIENVNHGILDTSMTRSQWIELVRKKESFYPSEYIDKMSAFVSKHFNLNEN